MKNNQIEFIYIIHEENAPGKIILIKILQKHERQ